MYVFYETCFVRNDEINKLLIIILLHIGTLHENIPLRWRHNGRYSISNHQPHGCLLNRLFRRNSKKTSKLRVTGLCVGNSPVPGEFPAQMASNVENVSIWWRHHALTRRQIPMSNRPVFFLWRLYHDVISWGSSLSLFCKYALWKNDLDAPNKTAIMHNPSLCNTTC